MLSFEETEDQRLLRDALSSIASNFPDSYWRDHDERAEFPQEYFETLASNGWFNLNVPTELGGTGLGLVETSISIHELSRRCGMSAGDIIMAICVFAIQTIKTFAQDPVKERLLPELGAGKHVMSFCLTEPEAGVNTLDIQTSAVEEGDGYLINGQKIWITLAHKATLLNVVARTTPKNKATKRTEGLSLFLVEKSKLKQGQIRTKKIEDISMRALGSNEVFFEDVFVPKENILGTIDKGWDLLPILLNAERISTASMSVGLGELVLQKAVEYAKNRQVFSRPIGSNQAIQFPLARSKADLEASWAVTQKAAWEFDQGLDCAVSANVAAFMGARSAFYTADRAIQTYGGLGYAKSSDIERHWRDSRLFRTGPVPEEMVLNFLGQKVLHLPRSY
ncbi:MAG: acyl-CoA/acyl-ACP dehydrogenase [Thaumarchaeota archaeon]|nr:acyl-CoA/acyl-ACP dehydrogenase [Nitrososphaerota archaeon]